MRNRIGQLPAPPAFSMRTSAQQPLTPLHHLPRPAQNLPYLMALAVAPLMLPAVNSILVKGSRFMRMERVVDALVAQYPSAPNGGNACS